MFTYDDNGFTIQTKAGKISLWGNDMAIGFTVENTKGSLNIVSENDFPPYIDFWGKVPGVKTPYVIYADEDGELSIQVGNKEAGKVKTYKVSDLIK